MFGFTVASVPVGFTVASAPVGFTVASVPVGFTVASVSLQLHVKPFQLHVKPFQLHVKPFARKTFSAAPKTLPKPIIRIQQLQRTRHRQSHPRIKIGQPPHHFQNQFPFPIQRCIPKGTRQRLK